jgi:hypothetical protein
MLRDLTKTLPRLKEYLELFPNQPRLQGNVRDIYTDYLDFCVDTINYLSRRPICESAPIYVFLTASYLSVDNALGIWWNWSSVKRKFESTMANLQRHKLDCEHEASFAHAQTSARLGEEIHTAITQIYVVPALSPPVISVPHSRNQSFVLRDPILEQINTYFTKGTAGSQLVSCVLHGMGGVGKTQAALEYTYRYQKNFDYIFWLRAESDPEIVETFGHVAVTLQLVPEAELQDQQRNIEKTRRWLSASMLRSHLVAAVLTGSTDTGWLLVFDNATDWRSLRPFWPSFPHGSVLVTTQNSDLCHVSTYPVALDPLDAVDGSVVLLKYLEINGYADELMVEDKKFASLIAAEVGGLPIAIAHIAGYIDQSRCSLAGFLDMFRERHRASNMWSKDLSESTTFQYERKLDTVWDIALGTLSAESNNLLSTMAMLNPDSIPEEMLISNHDNDWYVLQ